jgi:hypothetical protein
VRKDIKNFEDVIYCELLEGRVTDAKNRIWVGSEVSEALRKGKHVYMLIGEEVIKN